MTTPQKKLIIAAALGAVSVTLFVVQEIIDRKQRNKQTIRLDRFHRAAEELNKTIENVENELDRRIENARYWEIVTRDDK